MSYLKKIFLAPLSSLELVLAIMEDVNQKAFYRTQLLVTRKDHYAKYKEAKKGHIGFTFNSAKQSSL